MKTTTTKNGQSEKKPAPPPPPPPPGPPPDVNTPEGRKEFLARTQNGDRSLLPQVRELLAIPGQVEKWGGDVAAEARRRLVETLCKDNLLVAEAMLRRAELLRDELLSGGVGGAVERLLVERVTMNWLCLGDAEVRLHHLQQEKSALRLLEFAERRVVQRERRYLLSLKALSLVRKHALRLPGDRE